jgi:uncharacterized glyoxalase superfamily protein PhnB
MRMIILTIVSAVLMAAQEKTMTVKRLTPNLLADDVESCVQFWVERMHFEKTGEVPDGSKLAFAALQKGSFELMYQSYASMEKEPDAAGRYRKGTAFLFLEVDDLDAVLAAMQGAPMVTPVHKTFYGSTEFTVRDPAGHWITFAHFAAAHP